jgi:hypothetical protein
MMHQSCSFILYVVCSVDLDQRPDSISYKMGVSFKKLACCYSIPKAGTIGIVPIVPFRLAVDPKCETNETKITLFVRSYSFGATPRTDRPQSKQEAKKMMWHNITTGLTHNDWLIGSRTNAKLLRLLIV